MASKGWWLFPRLRVFEENVQPFIPCMHILFFFRGGGEISSRTITSLFKFKQGSVHSGSATSDDSGRVFPDELRVRSFPVRFLTMMPGQRHSQPTPTWLGQGCVRVKCNLTPALLAK